MEVSEGVRRTVPHLFKDFLKKDRHNLSFEVASTKAKASSSLIDKIFGSSKVLKEQQKRDKDLYFHPKLDEFSRIGLTTLHKFKSTRLYTMEQQLAMKRILDKIPDYGNNKRLKRALEIMVTRKQRRARYLLMLIGTKVDENNVHPITIATKKARKPYAETMKIICAKQGKDILPAEYLLDPSSLHTMVYKARNKSDGRPSTIDLVGRFARISVTRKGK